ncbi:MAG: hypothetical protein CMI02_03065 [Oceanospirillaceae bacterium]|nr:hypothetical protein [Oceanospirillaceae bacterium]MBT10997.1 hypothetical protein [Oceanospirillaceae bacterium]|tara:strand:+ start:114343 stop:114555 length:213 start_codon:yes stop_codon:yes gene_type:complete
MSFMLVCDGEITSALECPGGWVVTTYTPPFDITQLSPETAVQYFGAGFLLPVVPLSAALGVAILLKLLKG